MLKTGFLDMDYQPIAVGDKVEFVYDDYVMPKALSLLDGKIGKVKRAKLNNKMCFACVFALSEGARAFVKIEGQGIYNRAINLKVIETEAVC